MVDFLGCCGFVVLGVTCRVGFVLVYGLIVGLVLVSLICVFMHCVSLVGSARLCDCELLLGAMVVFATAGCMGGRLEVLLFWY